MYKILFLCIGAQKCTFWKFALDDLWWPWPDFDLPQGPKCFFLSIGPLKYTFWKFALGDLWYSWPPNFLSHWNYFGVVSLYCSQNSWNFDGSHDFYLQVDLWPCRYSCNCTCTLFPVIMFFIQLHRAVVLRLFIWYIFIMLKTSWICGYHISGCSCRLQDTFMHIV